MKMKKLLTAITIFSIVLMAGCKKDNMTAIVGVCPIVTSTSPFQGETSVILNKVITVTFNEAMNPATITKSSFTIMEGSTLKSSATTPVLGTITYSGTTASFTPSSPLAPNTNFYCTVTTSVKDVNGNALQVNHVWNFSTSTIPAVLSNDPLDLATNVVLNKVISAKFSEVMDSTSIIAASTFTLKQGTTPIAGTVSYKDTTAYFTPNNTLLANTTYTATISTAAKNLAGNSIASERVWTFTTSKIPTVLSTDPVNLATNVAINKVISAKFSEVMDSTSITAASTFTLKQGTTSIAGSVSYNDSTATFTPSSNLQSGTTYTATISTAAKNLAGNAIASNYVWTFTTSKIPTVLSTDPVNLATNVALNKVISAKFSQVMDSSTITAASTFTLKQGTTSIAGSVSYAGTTASFTPSSSLQSGTTYTATITTAAKNLAGNAMASNYVWTFTTGTIIAPTVLSTDPLDLATNVALNKVINATFSTAMNASTITAASTFTLKQGTTSIAGSVTYAGTTASFTPSSSLQSGKTYTATISTAAKDLAGNAIASNYVWTFSTGTIIAPTVLSTDPLDLATNVALNKVINATFSTAMDASTITAASTFTLKQGTTPIAGSVTYSGTTASFTPNSNLLGNTTYTATISTNAKNLAGNAMASDYVWSFTTLSSPPLGPGVVNLGTSGNFAILTKTGISNTGATLITGDIGVSPIDHTAITGFSETMDATNQFSTSIYVVGKIYAADYATPTPAYVSTAISDQETAFTTANGLTTNVIVDLGAGDISGMTLAPGLYKWSTGLLITNAGVTLSGGPNDTWVFQISGDFTIDNDAIITLAGGAQAKNIFWVTATQALLGSNVNFKGNLLAKNLISLNTSTTVLGRLLSQKAVTLQASIVTKP